MSATAELQSRQQFYINGQWCEPRSERRSEVVNPATEQAVARIALAGTEDVDAAVRAARAAFDGYAATTVAQRIDYLQRIATVYERRQEDLARAISTEMGAPITLARKAQAPTGLRHLKIMIDVLKQFRFEETLGDTRVMREPVGVCAFITPWNWPANQICCKLAPALAAGCTVVLKPSELAPLSAYLLAEIIDEAGLPPGVFNLVNGDGEVAGAALSSHPEVDMVSITGSTRAGAAVARAAADSVKRVTQELGGKSAYIILDDADFEPAVSRGMRSMLNNSGQSCNAPSRMLVPAARAREAAEIAARTAATVSVGDPADEASAMGPLANRAQFERVQAMIQAGIDEGAELICGGPGRPPALARGYYVQPTVFAGVNNQMRIAREEIFGPVLSILPYRDEEEAVAIANDTPYGLAGYVAGGDSERVRRVARRLRAGMISLNGAPPDFCAPFGGYKQSGNGREWGAFGLDDFLELKAIVGYGEN